MSHPRFATSLIALVLALAGCGDPAPQFDPAVNYSADTLAREFLFAYKELKTSNGSAVRAKGPKERPEAATKGAAARGEAVAKKAEIATLDELIGDTIRKASSIPGTPASRACREVIEAVAKDPSVPEVDKKLVAESLGRVAD